MIDENKLKKAYDLVRVFKKLDIKTNTYNMFFLNEYRVPEVNGIFKGEWGKGINTVKPSTLEYIIYHLHNADEDMILEAILVLLYYWKVKKKQPNKMKEVYKKVYNHFTTVNTSNVPDVNTNDKYVVYSVSLSIGSIRINKFGYTNDSKRFYKMISNIKQMYPNVSVGNFKVNQIVQFPSEEVTKEFEKEAISNLKKHKDYKKVKFCFNGYLESYLNIDLDT